MKFNATTRSVQGSSASRRLRHAGRVPAIVYGGTSEPKNIELDHNEIFHALRKEQFHSSILEMQLEGKSEQVLLRSVQWHAYRQLVLHVDFQRVDAKSALHTKVPLHFINEESSPAVKLNAAVVTHIVTELEISCLPKNLPPFIEVDLGNLLVGEPLHLSHIKLPNGVTYIPHGAETDPILASANVKGPQEIEEDEAAPAQGDDATDAPQA
jgi:large subunit ribosomal protein L25